MSSGCCFGKNLTESGGVAKRDDVCHYQKSGEVLDTLALVYGSGNFRKQEKTEKREKA